MSKILELKKLSIGYGRKIVLNDIDLEISKGDFLGIVGQNGSGKTTILRAVLGMIKPQKGEIIMDRSKKIGYVPQLNMLDDIFPVTAREVIDMNAVNKESGREIESIAEKVGLNEYLDKPFRDLSGGLRKRTLIARALIAKPEILLLDEPTNDLDLGSGEYIMGIIDKLNKEDKITIIMVNHMVNVVINNADKIAFLLDGTLQAIPVSELENTEKLREIYGIELKMANINGKKILVT